MKQDSGVALHRLKVDGGMTASKIMLQIQADVLEDVTVGKFMTCNHRRLQSDQTT